MAEHLAKVERVKKAPRISVAREVMPNASKRPVAAWLPRAIRDRIRQRQLENQLHSLELYYDEQLNGASEDLAANLAQQWELRSSGPEYELGRMLTDRLLKRADKRGILVPNDDGLWVEPDWELQARYLSKTGLVVVRRMIRDDFRQSMKWYVDVLIPPLTLILGIVGALTGLLAILKRP